MVFILPDTASPKHHSHIRWFAIVLTFIWKKRNIFSIIVDHMAFSIITRVILKWVFIDIMKWYRKEWLMHQHDLTINYKYCHFTIEICKDCNVIIRAKNLNHPMNHLDNFFYHNTIILCFISNIFVMCIYHI